MASDYQNLVGYQVRKVYTQVEEISHDDGDPLLEPILRAAVAVVIRNPFSGAFGADLSSLTEPSPGLGTFLGQRLNELLAGQVQSYGKGGIAGVAGHQEHVVACVTTVFGDTLRAAVGGGAAWISSATKRGSLESTIDIPLAHKDALYVRSHYDAVSVRVPDAPRPDELVIIVCAASGGRVHARVGGLAVSEIEGNGLT